MKLAVNWILVAVDLVMLITWGVSGVSIANGNYEAVTPCAYIMLACLVVSLVLIFYKKFGGKCPHCGMMNTGSGEYCSHCGKKKE